MNRFTDFLLIIVRLLLFFVILLGLYGWFWFPSFQNGSASGPYWLPALYDTVVPFILQGSLIGIVLIGVYRFFVYLWPGASPSRTVGTFGTLLLWLIGAGFFGGLPSFVADYTHLDSSDFAGQNYQLILRQNSNVANYMVFECSDPVGLWCRQVLLSPNMSPVPPTPVPVEQEEPLEIEQDDQTFRIEPTPAPTATPPARFITDSTGRLQLSLQIGNLRQVITTTNVATDTLPALDNGDQTDEAPAE